LQACDKPLNFPLRAAEREQVVWREPALRKRPQASASSALSARDQIRVNSALPDVAGAQQILIGGAFQ
jgi:hypothetical protein